MITIGKPFVYADEQTAYLKAKIDISPDTVADYMALKDKLPKTHWRFYEDYPPRIWDDKDSGLFFAVSKEYEQYLCADRSDAFVVAMLWYALMSHSDIRFETPISEKLYFGITQLLIPAVCKKYPPIRLHGPTASAPLQNAEAVGTGMSCGVDSLYTLQKYVSEDVPAAYRLTHLAYFNMGAIFHPNTAVNKEYAMEEFYRETDRMSLEKLENAKGVADASGLQLVYSYSNLDRDYYRGAYGYTGVYRNCAMALAVQGLFGKYYCSSAGWPEFFDLSLSEGSEHYETLLCDAFSTETLQFIISDYATRIEKTTALADDAIAQQYLDVCFNFNNCGTCAKCMRTLLTLEALGKVDAFSQVFDIAAYKNRRTDVFFWLLNAKDGDALDDNAVFARSIYELIKEKQIPIPEEAVKRYDRELRKKRTSGVGYFLRRVKRRLKKILKRG